MQDEWLQQVSEREERRLHKIIKVTNTADERKDGSVGAKKPHNRGIGDEFIDRVRERRCKLQIPSDSDWDSGAESQPAPRERKSPCIDPNVKVVDGGNVADIKQLPRHIKEFAEFTEKCSGAKQTAPAREIVHRIQVEGAVEQAHSKSAHAPQSTGAAASSSDGESTAWSVVLFGMCVALVAAVAIHWTIKRTMVRL